MNTSCPRCGEKYMSGGALGHNCIFTMNTSPEKKCCPVDCYCIPTWYASTACIAPGGCIELKAHQNHTSQEEKESLADFFNKPGEEKEPVMLEVARAATNDQREQIGLPPLSHSPESWEEEFSKIENKWYPDGQPKNYLKPEQRKDIRAFIQATRELAKKEERGRIALKEGEKIDCPMSVCCSGCYEAAIEDRLEKTS